jgi:hypothetical protein
MDEPNKKLTSGEVSQLWSNYMNDSMSICLHTYYKEKVEDPEISDLITFALELSKSHIQKITAIFKSQNNPIPIGFAEKDVNLSAPRLYTDNYYLYFLHFWSAVGLEAYSLSLSIAANSDIVQYFSQCIDETKELLNRTKKVLLSKGLFIRSPYIPTSNQVDFVHKKSFLAGWFRDQRPLTSIEIANLSINKDRNHFFLATLTGLSQVVEDTEVGKIIVKGKELALKNINDFDAKLRESELPSPETWDTMVTSSTTSPFSDNLIMFHLSTMISSAVSAYGTSLGASTRHDLGALYSKILGELLLYAKDTANLMIDKGWMEQPPSMVNRDELLK